MPAVIEVEHLEKRYGEFVAVDDVSFSVEDGEIFGILGPNGAGKTTTVECLQGLRRPDGGGATVLGLDPRREADRLRKLIGSQLQASVLPERMRVWEALKLFTSRHTDAPDWETVLHRWGLTAKRNASFGSLSGGQQQRLFVALAVAHNPRLVFLDEMTTGLDPMSRRVTWDLVSQVRDAGTTVVLVTHFMDEAEQLCDRVAVIDKGRLVALDTTAGLIAHYAETAQVTFSTDLDDVGFLLNVTGVESVDHRGHRVIIGGTGALLARVAAALAARQVFPLDLEVKRASLEDVFLSIVGEGA